MSLLKNTLISTISQLLGRAANLLIPFLVVAFFGASNHSDFFFLGLSISFFFYGTLSNALTDALAAKLITSQQLLPRKVVFRLSLIAFLITFASAFFAFGFMNFFGVGVSVGFGMISGLGVYAISFLPVLIKEGDFSSSGLSWFCRLPPILALLSISTSLSTGILLFVFAIVIGDLVRVLYLKSKTNRFDSNKYHPITYRELFKFWPYLGGTVLMGLSPIVDRLYASMGSPGDVTAYEIADRIFWMFATFTTIGLQGVLLLEFGNLVNNNKLNKRYWARLNSLIFSLSIPISVLLIFLGKTVVIYGDQWIFDKMSMEQRQVIRECIFIYAFALPTYLLSMVAAKVLIIKQHYSKLLVGGAITLASNILASLPLYILFGLPGIATGTLISSITTCIYCQRWALEGMS